MVSQQIYINLLKRNTTRDKLLLELLIFSLVSAFLVVGMFYSYFFRLDQLAQEKSINNRLSKELLKYSASKNDLNYINKLGSELTAKKQVIKQIEGQGLPLTSILTTVEKAMPTDVTLISMDIKNNKIQETGYAPDYFQVAQLIAGLKQDTRFTSVDLVSANVDEEAGKIKFIVDMIWKGK
jgi:Tfp pilus assembly protein PilN